MQKTHQTRAIIVVVVNLLVGGLILWLHNIQSLFLPFSVAAVALLTMALMAMRPPRVGFKAVLLSFIICVLVPMIGLWLERVDESTFESFLLFGLIGVGLGLKECLLMFALNTGLLIWSARP